MRIMFIHIKKILVLFHLNKICHISFIAGTKPFEELFILRGTLNDTLWILNIESILKYFSDSKSQDNLIRLWQPHLVNLIHHNVKVPSYFLSYGAKTPLFRTFWEVYRTCWEWYYHQKKRRWKNETLKAIITSVEN